MATQSEATCQGLGETSVARQGESIDVQLEAMRRLGNEVPPSW